MTLLPDKKHRLETKIKRRTLNPRWNETFYFEGERKPALKSGFENSFQKSLLCNLSSNSLFTVESRIVATARCCPRFPDSKVAEQSVALARVRLRSILERRFYRGDVPAFVSGNFRRYRLCRPLIDRAHVSRAHCSTLIGGLLGETFVLESSEASGEGQVRGAAVLAVLPSQQLCSDSDTSKGEKSQGEGHQRKVR